MRRCSTQRARSDYALSEHDIIPQHGLRCDLPANCVPVPGFVLQQGTQLYLDGEPFYFVGMNAYWMPTKAAYGEADAVDRTMADGQVHLPS